MGLHPSTLDIDVGLWPHGHLAAFLRGIEARLGVDVHHLGSPLVRKQQQVVVLGDIAPLAQRLEAGQVDIGRQVKRRVVGAVVDAAGDDRTVRVAPLE